MKLFLESQNVELWDIRKIGHIKIDYPLLKKDFKRGDPKKKATMATWEDTYSSSSNKDEEQAANLCIMAELYDFESVIDFSHQKELEQALDNLLNDSHILTKKCAILKEQLSNVQKENEKLIMDNELFFKEKPLSTKIPFLAL
ncbi:hypothetical protein HKD37_05G012951 [Glycine soja]